MGFSSTERPCGGVISTVTSQQQKILVSNMPEAFLCMSTCAYKHFLKVLHFRQSKYILVKLNHDSK